MRYQFIINKKHAIFAVIVLLMCSSCNDELLDETPLDFLAPENAFTTLAGIRQGSEGLYFSVRQSWYDLEYSLPGMGGGSNNSPFVIMHGNGTDVSFQGQSPGGNLKLVNYQIEMTPENVQFTQFWNKSYRFIQRANVFLEQINASNNEIWENEAQKNVYLAEAKFFRAFAYRILVSLYGDVPLVTDVIKSPKTDFVRNSKAEVYKLMEDDLTFAAANLPRLNSETALGSVTQGAAWHFLCETYLAQAKYQLAVEAATHVIDDFGYELMTNRFGSTKEVFGSGDVYLDLFAYGNHNLPENIEAIWVIQIEPLITGGSRNGGDRAYGPAYYRLGNTPDGYKAFRGEFVGGNYTGYSDTIGRPVAIITPTYYASNIVWKSDWNNDIRNAKHNIKRDYFYDNPASIFHRKKIDFTLYPAGTRNLMMDTCQYIYPFFMKFADPCNHFDNPATSGNGYHHKDIYALRLAETILLRAEAYIGLGDQVNAAADINLIRSRSNATPVNPVDVDIDYLLDERVRELYGEEWRQITLRRVGKLLERVRKYNNNPVFPACNIQDHNVLFPIPQSQIDLNVDAKLEQNPGY